MSEVLLRYILWKHYKILLNEVKFEYNVYGKPSLARNTNLYFSISHSDEWILCAVSEVPIGIDVEKIVEDVIGIANRFYTKEEVTYIEKKLPINRDAAFCKIWTLKESYVKCIGKGLSIPLNSFWFFF